MRAITQFVGDRKAPPYHVGMKKALSPSELQAAGRILEAVRASTLALAPDEAALLAKYRAADTAGKRSLQAVSDALAVYGDQRKVWSNTKTRQTDHRRVSGSRVDWWHFAIRI